MTLEALAAAGGLALLAAALIPALRRHRRDREAETAADLARLTDEQRAAYARLTARSRRRRAAEDAERARAEALTREQDERERRSRSDLPFKRAGVAGWPP